MTEIELRFDPRFEQSLRSGMKTCTIRRSRHGARDDTFVAFGIQFRIDSVSPLEAEAAVREYYPLLSLRSPQRVREVLLELYGDAAPRPGQIVFVHTFHREVPLIRVPPEPLPGASQ